MLMIVGVDACTSQYTLESTTHIRDEMIQLTSVYLCTPSFGILTRIHNIGVKDSSQLDVRLDGTVLLQQYQ
jgi:hypothetical protein